MQASASHALKPFGALVRTVAVKPGTTIAETMPLGRGLMICKLNGGPGYCSRSTWDYRMGPGDVVEWEEHPAGGDDEAGIFQLALIVVGTVVNAYVPGLGTALIAVGSYAYNSINAGEALQPQRNETSPTYSTSIQGNQARLYQAVPKICGRHQTYPPFAAQPYTEFDGESTQYLYVLLALGEGQYEIERMLIDDTDINHFSDVLTATYLPPGVLPSAVKANVINSPEVAGQDMLTGERIGGFAACGPRRLAAAIGIDIIAPEGLGLQDGSGEVGELEVEWRVEIRSLNEFGTPLTPWAALATETRTGASREPQRWSVRYELDPPIRPEIRIVRMDPKSLNARALNDLVWSGMRAYLDGDAPLSPAVSHIEIVMRSSKQLSNVSQNRISVIATGMARELLSDLTFGDLIATRNAADWLADLWTSTTWGLGEEPEQCDLRSLYDLRVLWDQRQDRFDYVFDSAIDGETAGQIIAGSGRARCFRRGGVRSLIRDQLVTLPRTAFHTRNTAKGSMLGDEDLPQKDLPDGVIVEYWDNRAWNFGLPIECPAPGVVSMLKPVRIRLNGVTGRKHATREGLYEAARLVLRRRNVSCVTEMQGMLPAFGSAVRWQSEVSRWQAGDVVEWDPDTGAMRLSEPPDWSAGQVHLILIADDGTPTDPIAVTPGSLTTEVVLAGAPPFEPSTEDGTRDRTQYLLGRLGVGEMLVKVASIEDLTGQDGAPSYRVTGFVDDDRIHQADIAYLPSPGEIQDPIDTSEGEPGGGTIPVVNINGYTWGDTSSSGVEIPPVHYYLNNDGSAAHDFATSSAYTPLPQEWLYASPVDTSITDQFEARVTVLSGALGIGSDVADTWLSMSTSRVWTDGGGGAVTFRIEIRDTETETLQDSAIIDIQNFGAVGG